MGPKTAQDAPGTTIVTSGDLQVPLISSVLRLTSACKRSTDVLDSVRAIEEGVDAAVPVDAQNAPTSDLEHCRQFSTAPTPIIVFLEEERRTTRERQTQRNRIWATVQLLPMSPDCFVTYVPGRTNFRASACAQGHKRKQVVIGHLSNPS